jgi:hypothetical protein
MKHLRHTLPVVLAVLALDAATAEAKETHSPGTEKKAEPQFKNIQVLKGMPASQMGGAMRFISASLGVGCDYCHVITDQGHWMEKDDKETKKIARKMILMTRAINHANFEDKPEVSCATCHHGRNEPLRQPPVGRPVEDEVVVKSDSPAPTVDEVLAKYRQALGGDAVAKVTTRVIKASLMTVDGTSWDLQMEAKAPDKLYSRLALSNGIAERGFDGKVGWMRNPDGTVADLHGMELLDTQRMSNFQGALNVRDRLPDVKVRGQMKLGDRQTWRVDAKGAGDTRERLYFDVDTGLLDRTLVLIETPLGELPEQTDYAHYQEVNAVKFPFRIERASAGMDTVTTILDVKFNEPVDDSKFERPPAVK